MRLMPYKMGSKSAKALADALGTVQVYRDNSSFRNNYDHTIVNWGCSAFNNEFPVANWINNPDAVSLASNKLSCFEVLAGSIPDNIPEWTANHHKAFVWARTGSTVVCRSTLTGHSGEGIYLYNYKKDMEGMPHDHQGNIPLVPLYVKYIKKQDEFRVHVINGVAVDVQQKRKRRDVENSEVDYQVRCSATGWVYCRDAICHGEVLTDLAVEAVKALGLDFGGVDIIYNAKADKFYVLEVNTAMGLEGSTVDMYAEGIRGML